MAVTVTFTDGVNPLPSAITVAIYAGSTATGVVVASGYTDATGSIAATLSSGSAYTAVFGGVQAPSAPLTFLWQASNFIQPIPNYASPSLSQTGFANEEAALWVRGAFGDAARTTNGNAYNLALGISSPLAALNAQIQAIHLAERLSTCTGSEIDAWAADYFGSTLPRDAGETDAAYIGRIEANLSARKGTAAGLVSIGTFFGTTTVVEPWMVGFTGACDSPTLACDSTEGCVGSQAPDVSVFIEVSSVMPATVAVQAALSVAGAKPAGVTVNAFEVVGTTATPLVP